MKKTIVSLVTASILAAGAINTANSGWINDMRQRFESINEDARNQAKLVNTVKSKYNRIADKNNNDENRTKNFHWQFYDLTEMPPKDDKPWSTSNDGYESANGTSDAIFYLNDKNAIVGVKSYYESFTGDVSRYTYVAEKYALNGKSWSFAGNYHKCTTDSRGRPLKSSQSLMDKLETWFK